MRLTFVHNIKRSIQRTACIIGIGSAALIPCHAQTWQTITKNGLPVNFGAGTMILLTDGSVMCQNNESYIDGNTNQPLYYGSSQWYRLTPDANGSYTNPNLAWVGTHPMNVSRLYYASAVLGNGDIFVAGGEYDGSQPGVQGPPSMNAAEYYDPVTNVWTFIRPVPGWDKIGDAQCKLLPDGRPMIGQKDGIHTAIASNDIYPVWSFGGDIGFGATTSDEASWALLPDQTILSINTFGNVNHAQKYVPSLGSWVDAGTSNVSLVATDGSGEMGPMVLLANGKCFCIGETGRTALYIPPASPAGIGTWQVGPTIPNGYQVKDAPACLETNGKVLLTVGPPTTVMRSYPGPTYFYEYDPNAPIATAIMPAPNAPAEANPPFAGRMLMLPTGQILYSDMTTPNIRAYTSTGTPDAAWRPIISSVTRNNNGSYQLMGTQLNGMSECAYYGDDASMSTNYPIVKIVNTSTGRVWYARTFNRNNFGVATGATPITTSFTVPNGMGTGPFVLYAIANGIASNAWTFVP